MFGLKIRLSPNFSAGATRAPVQLLPPWQGMNLTLWSLIHLPRHPFIFMEVVIKHQYVLNSHFSQVQYYSSVLGTHKRRRRLKAEWYFFWCLDHYVHKYLYRYFWCMCERCKDPTELQTNVAGVTCELCEEGVMLPRWCFTITIHQ